MNNFKNKNVYISGIGGIGISAFARLLISQNCKVYGSDIEKNHITELLEKLGIEIKYNQYALNMPNNIDLHIYSPAVQDTNKERLWAKENNIESLNYPQALAQVTKEFYTIAISGTNGKTTTTAIVAHTFIQAGLDPTCIVGSFVNDWKSNFKKGNSEFLIIEACEHRAHMNNYFTKDIIITNIEEDHLDYYKDINDIILAFEKFCNQNNLSFNNTAKIDGKIILNADDKNSQSCILQNKNAITYGIKNNANFKAFDIKIKNSYQEFSVKIKGKDKVFENWKIKFPGVFNVYNALACIAYCVSVGIEIKIIQKALETFNGTWRRFERLGFYKNMLVISDYGHHPSAVLQTIIATKEFYPTKKIMIVFQPHQHNRTKNLFNDFIKAFDNADIVILNEIFDVVGREEEKDQNISSQNLSNELQNRGVNSFYAKTQNDVLDFINKFANEEFILVIMGAGDIYKLAEHITKK